MRFHHLDLSFLYDINNKNVITEKNEENFLKELGIGERTIRSAVKELDLKASKKDLHLNSHFQDSDCLSFRL